MNSVRRFIARAWRRFVSTPRRWTASPGLHKVVRRTLFRQPRQSTGNKFIAAASSILILKSDEIGDVVLATNFLKSIRQQCPKAHITLLVRALCGDLVAGTEYADELVLLPGHWRGTRLGAATILEICRTAWARWSKHPPDWVIIPRSGLDVCGAAYYAHWTGAPHICVHEGFCDANAPSLRPLVTDVIVQSEPMHEVAYHQAMLRHLHLEESVQTPAFTPDARGIAECDALLLGHSVAERPMISLGIGAGMPDKVWPSERFAQLTQLIHGAWPDALMVVVGGPQDAEAAIELCKALPGSAINAAGILSLAGTLALLDRCILHVGNDSGPMHLAAAVGTPVVAVFKHPRTGSDQPCHSPVRFGPLVSPNRIVQPQPLEPECKEACRYGEPHCILNVSTQEVFAAVSELLPDLLSAPQTSSPDRAPVITANSKGT